MLAFADKKFVVKDELIFSPNRIKEIYPYSPIQLWYLHICKENERHYTEYIKDIILGKYRLIKYLRHTPNFRQLRWALKTKINSSDFNSWRRRQGPLILIEPIGLLSTEWFSRTFQTKTLILIRHPASIVSSMKRLNWNFDFSNFLNQEYLIKHYFSDFEQEIRNSPPSTDIIGQGILIWRLIHSVIMKFQERYPEWIFIRHEELAKDPISGFKNLYDRLGMKFTSACQKKIMSYSSSSNPDEMAIGETGNEASIRRNSMATITNWKKRLTPTEIARIKDEVQGISSNWYNEEDW